MGRSFTPQGAAGTPFEGQELLSAFVCTPLQASVNNYLIAQRDFVNASLLQISSTAAVNVTGLQGAVTNRDLTLINTGAFAITLKDNSGASIAANRFRLGADVVLAALQGIRLIGTPVGWVSAGGGGGGGSAPVALAASVHNSANNLVANNTNVLLSFDTVDFDTGAPTPFYNAATPTVLTAPVTGNYLACATAAWQAPGTVAAESQLSFIKNGVVGTLLGQSASAFVAGINNALALTVLMHLVAGDTVSALAFQNSGDLEVVVGGTTTTFGLMAIH